VGQSISEFSDTFEKENTWTISFIVGEAYINSFASSYLNALLINILGYIYMTEW